MKNIFYLVLLIILFGCNRNTQTNNSVSDTSAVYIQNINQIVENTSTHIEIDTIVKSDDSRIRIDSTLKSVFQKEYNSLINMKVTRWVKFYKKNCSSFYINDFTLCSTNYLNPYLIDFFIDETEKKKFIELYKPYLIWSSDSSKAIDLYSTGVYLDFDELGNKYIEYGEDSYVQLIDFKNKKRIVLIQRGIFSHFDDGFWIDENNLLITEIGKNLDNEVIDDKFLIEYHVINLNTYQTSRYCSKKTYNPDNSYLSLVFKGIKENE